MPITLPQIANPDDIPQAPAKPAGKPAVAPQQESTMAHILRERKASPRTTKADKLYQKVVAEIAAIQDPLQREFQRNFWEDELSDLFDHPVKIPDPVEMEARDIQRAQALLADRESLSKALVREAAIAMRTMPGNVKDALSQKLGLEITPDMLETDPQGFLQVATELDAGITEADLLRAGIETDQQLVERKQQQEQVKERAETASKVAGTIKNEAEITKAATEYAEGPDLEEAIGKAESAHGASIAPPGGLFIKDNDDLDTGRGALGWRKLLYSERASNPLGATIVDGAFLAKWKDVLHDHLEKIGRAHV